MQKSNLLIILAAVIVALSFTTGIFYSCREGELSGMNCVQPKIVELVQVCAYSEEFGICSSRCAEGIVTDREAFNKIYYPLKSIMSEQYSTPATQKDYETQVCRE